MIIEYDKAINLRQYWYQTIDFFVGDYEITGNQELFFL